MQVKQAANWCDRDIGAGLSILIAGAIGTIYCYLLLGRSAIFNATPFWDLPVGLSGNSLDIRNTLAGYWWFVLDGWRWPLLSTVAPNWPDGANAERFDIVPLVALLGKIVRAAVGGTETPYPLWVTACYTLNAAALAALLRSLGQRGWFVMVVAGAFGAMAPVIQARFGHLGLIAHWIPIFALALYFDSRTKRLPWIGILVLCAVAVLVHLYLYVMTAAIAIVIAVQATLNRRCTPFAGAMACALILVVGVTITWALGILQEQDLASVTGDYRRYSMNLVSPFWPQTSGLFRWTKNYWLTRGMIGATPGQYEGFSYLGGGGVLLVLVAIMTGWHQAGRISRHHYILVALLVVLTIWALSDRVYFGPWLVLSYEAPAALANTILVWFRSCGRLFWPVAWLLLACGIAATASLRQRRLAFAFLLVAVILQVIDVAPWRDRIRALTDHPAASMFGSADNAAKVEQMIQQAGSVVLRPQIGCSSAGWDYTSPLNVQAMEVQLLAARANARMRHPYLSRAVQNCDEADLLEGKRIVILLHDPIRPPLVPEGAACQPYGEATVCVIDR